MSHDGYCHVIGIVIGSKWLLRSRAIESRQSVNFDHYMLVSYMQQKVYIKLVRASCLS